MSGAPTQISQFLSKKLPSNQSDSTTERVHIIDHGKKNAEGQTARDVLIELLYKFDTYTLDTRQGSEEAIQDMECRLQSAGATFEPAPRVAPRARATPWGATRATPR